MTKGLQTVLTKQVQFTIANFVYLFLPIITAIYYSDGFHSDVIRVQSQKSEVLLKKCGRKDLRFRQIVYILVFYNISFSWLLSLDGFQFFCVCRVMI